VSKSKTKSGTFQKTKKAGSPKKEVIIPVTIPALNVTGKM
jgi:hypothetical protein